MNAASHVRAVFGKCAGAKGLTAHDVVVLTHLPRSTVHDVINLLSKDGQLALVSGTGRKGDPLRWVLRIRPDSSKKKRPDSSDEAKTGNAFDFKYKDFKPSDEFSPPDHDEKSRILEDIRRLRGTG